MASLADQVVKTGGRGIISSVSGDGSSRGGGSGATAKKRKDYPTGGDARVWVRYDAHLNALYLQDGENLRSIPAGMVLPTLHGAVLCKNCNFCRVCWEDFKRKCLHSPTPPEVATTAAGMLNVALGEWHAFLQPSGDSPSLRPKPQSDIALNHLGKCSQLSGWTEKWQYKEFKSLSSSTNSLSNRVDTLEHETSHPA